jgi:MraZ protein
MIRFIGSKEYRMDEKGRVPLLPQWRKLLGDRVYMTVGLNNSIWGFTQEGWDRLTADLDAKALPDDDTIDLSYALVSDAFEAEIDKQGRIMIPQQVREELKLGEEVMAVGVVGHFEIRDRAGWEQVRSSARAATNAKRQAARAVQK